MIRRIRNGLLMGIAVLLLSACSRTVKWEEEVPLNTGEVIWVERSVEYSIQGDAGNPMDLAWRPRKEQALAFDWKGKRYRYVGDACLQVLTVHEDVPVLIADSQCHGWNWTHNYDKCLSHVQINAISPNEWDWIPGPQEWIYGLKTNLVIDFSDRDRLLKKIDTKLRESYQTKDPQLRFLTEITKPSIDFSQRCNKETNK